MALNFGLLKFLLFLALVHNAISVPITTQRSPIKEIEESESKLVEIKLPVKITSMDDLIAWAKNAMRSMASRIDITLASVDEPTKGNRENLKSSPRELKKSKGDPVSSYGTGTPTSGALVSTYASLFGPENSFASIIQGQNDIGREVLPRGENELIRDTFPRGNVNAYLPLLLDDTEIAKYREEALKKYYWESEEAKREKDRKGSQDKRPVKYSQVVAAQTSQVSVGDEERNGRLTGNSKDEKKIGPVISVPFEAIVTITRENSPEPTRTSFAEIRDPPDEFPPYFEKDFPRQEVDEKKQANRGKKIKDNSQKRQIATLGDLLRMLGLTKRLTSKNTRIKQFDGSAAQTGRPRKPSEKFTPPPKFQFEDQTQRQRRNETSERQEFDEDEEDEEEESMGSLGSITDLLPLAIPILEDISDPNSDTDLGEILDAAIPLVAGLSEAGDDDDAPDILGMIGPILTKIIGGKDGQGSDVAAVLGPLISLIAPLIGPILGPLVGPLLTASSNPPQGEGSSLATLLTAVLGPLTQTTEHSGMSPLSILTAGVIAALSKELKPGLPGGLDVGALVGAVLSGVIAGTSAGLSGSLSGDKNQHQSYGPYGAGPVQAGSVNTRTSAGYVVPGSQNHRPIAVPGNILDHRTIGQHSTRRPYATLPQRISPGPQPRPPPPTYIQHIHATGPLQAGTTNGGSDGGSSYLPYGGTNAVPANSANPISLVGTAIKDILGAGVNVVSSVINAVFGIIGASSSDDQPARPVYGPPPPSSYSQAGR